MVNNLPLRINPLRLAIRKVLKVFPPNGVNPTPPIFDGTYAFYPFATDGNNTVTAGVKINERLGDKIFSNDSGDYVTVGEYETAYTGSGELDEPSATTQIVTDMSAWDDLVGSDVTYNDTTKENVWTFTGPGSSRAFTNSALTQGLDYTLSLDVKKGESQFLQITGSSGFDIGIVVNYDLLNGIANVQGTAGTLKDFGLVDLGDYFRVYFTAEATNSPAVGRIILCKATSLTSERLPDSPIDGQFTVKYPNLVQASYASSPIDAPLAPATRDSDKAAVPTSDVWVDGGCFSSDRTTGNYVNGINRISGSAFNIHMNSGSTTPADFDGKYLNKVTASMIGAILAGNPAYTVLTNHSSNILQVSHPNNTQAELIDLFGNDGTSTNKYPVAWHYSTLTLAECKKLREDAKDVPDFQLPITPSYQVDPQWSSSEASISGNVVNINLDTGGGVEDVIDVTLDSTSLTEIDVGTVASTVVILERISGTGNIYFPGLELLAEGENSTFFTFDSSPSLPFSTTLIAVDGAIECKVTIVSYKIYRWLDWPAKDVVFELDFTLYSNDPNELFHIEWANAAKDTYVARTGDALEFNHGNDTLTIPYANLIVLGDTYKGHAVITAAELIGYVNGVEVARMTRTDTALAEWSSKCYMGGFNDTLAPVKLAKLKVLDYVAPPPVGSQLIVGDFSPLSGTAGDSALLPDGALGSLLPPVLVDGLAINFIQSVFNDFGDGAKKWVLCGNNTQDFTTNLTLTFNGTSYSFVRGAIALNPNTNAIQSDALYDFLTVNQNVSVDFTAEATAPQGSQLIVEDFSAQGGVGASIFDTGQLTGTAAGSLSPPISLGSLGNIYAVLSSSNTLPNKVVALQLDNTAPGQTINAYFNGQSYIFTFNPSIGYAVESDALYDFLTANQNTPIDFTAEVAADFADNGDFANNGDFA